ncbi:MAG: peptidylprolyl isomerase [Planctomycetota bacterium]|jgi:foldase protein PrsA
MKNRIFIFSTILLTISIILNNNAVFDLDAKADDVVAVVNGQELNRKELADLLIDTYGREGVDRLIRRTLIKQEAKRLNVKVNEDETAERKELIVKGETQRQMKKNGLKDEEDLKRELEKAGATIEQYQKSIIKKYESVIGEVGTMLLAEKIIKKTINITDEELNEAYEEQFGEKIVARQIVLRMMRDAEKILKRIKTGADFEAVAKKESIDRASASRGGRMRPFGPHGILGKATAKLKKGEISEIIKTDSGYHILKIDNRIPRSMKKFSEVKDELVKFVTARKIQNRISPWLLNLVETAEITRNLPD